MYLQYGSYTHALHKAVLAIQKESILNDAQVPYQVEIRWDISSYLQAAGQPSLTTAIVALETAYSNARQNAIFAPSNARPALHINGPAVLRTASRSRGVGPLPLDF